MGRRVLAGLILAAFTAPGLMLLAAGVEGCACIRAACCCPKRPSAEKGCHHGRSDASPATLRCGHSSSDIQLTATVGELPTPTPALRVDAPIRRTADLLPSTPLDGF